MTTSALYVGDVVHSRRQPRQHRLHYRCFWLLLDLDQLSELSQRLKLFSHNRWNVFSFRDRDHGDQTGRPLRAYVEAQLAAAGVPFAGGKINLLTMPRILGYAFNPISVYFCYSREDCLVALLYEVRNTFGERHSYLIPVESETGGVIQQSCRKSFHVSPFMDMGLDYDFRVTRPAEALSVVIRAGDKSGVILIAALAARRRALTDRALAWLLASQPLLTLKVLAAIHYEALKLVLKGIALRPHPAPPTVPVSIAAPGQQQSSQHV